MVDTMMGVGTKSFQRLLHDALGKRKCLKLRKANKQAKFEGYLVPDFWHMESIKLILVN